uniref:polyketide synthase dehydratase domain-containing protein n=1 Tax=Actinoplanes sp. DH11 TaxID=2857011 RepID=UPI001E406AD0
GRDEPDSLVKALAVAGPDWAKVFPGARRIELPTYAFQHQRYWLNATIGSRDEGLSAGLRPAGHALLSADVALADSDGVILNGRIGLDSHPWLADHTVQSRIVVPGAAFIEMAMHAAQRVDCDLLDELTIQAPLMLQAHAPVLVQVTVSADDGSGRRAISIHSSRDNDVEDAWTCHATGVLNSASDNGATAEGLPVWPPVGAEELPVAGWYDALAAAGLGYGPAFQGLRGLWRRDGEVFADVNVDVDVEGFGIHPVLLDAVLHAIP